jgi:DNA-binding SARP family transcriptional activator
VDGKWTIDRALADPPSQSSPLAERKLPDGIELLEERPVPPLVDEVAFAIRDCLDPNAVSRPLIYTIDGSDVTCSSETPFSFSPVADVDAQRLIATVSRPEPATSIESRDPRFGLATIPATNTTATVIDLFAADLTSIVGTSECVLDVVRAIARTFLARRERETDVLVVGNLAIDNALRVATAEHACTVVGSTRRPLVIFVDTASMASDAFERLIVASRRHPAVGVVATHLHPDARVVVAAADGGRSSVLMRAVTPKAVRAVGSHTTITASRQRKHPANAVEVSILGPVEIRNTVEPLGGHPLLTELVVYLAMHPEGATTSAWETAIWPNRRMPQQTIANRLSEARRALGDADDGRPRMRKVDERHLIADVTTDWQEFRSLSESEDAASWRGALRLVRGRPFGDLHEGQWALLEGFSAEIEHAISSVALRYGGFALRSGDPDAATWAAHRGLRATPWDERLHRLLMEAADANGDRAGVEATLRHLALVLEIDGDPLRAVHPETARLYERLLGRPPSSLSGALA